MRLALHVLLFAGFAPAQELAFSSYEIARMETALLSNPHDQTTRARLMSYYFQHGASQPRMAHVLWVIEHHPESKLAGSPMAGVSRSDLLNTRSDYEAARLLWLKQAESQPANAAVLANAGRFLAAEEPQRAEALLLKAWQLDPADKTRLATLAGFYAGAIADCDFHPDVPAGGSVCSDSGWIQEVKSRLESTAPSPLVRAVAASLTRSARTNIGIGFWRDPDFLQRLQSRAAN